MVWANGPKKISTKGKMKLKGDQHEGHSLKGDRLKGPTEKERGFIDDH